MSFAVRDGYISGTSLCGHALVVRNWRGVYVCASSFFTPSFQLIIERYWLWGEADAWLLLDTLDDEEVRRLLRIVPHESVGSGILPSDAGRALRQRAARRLLDYQIKLYHFDEREYAFLNVPFNTLLVDMRRVQGDQADAPNASLQQVSESIACQLSILLAERGMTKDSWDSTLQQEPWYRGMIIRLGAVVAGAKDFASGIADTASLIVDTGKAAGEGMWAVARFHYQFHEALLTNNFDEANRLVRDLGGKVEQGISSVKRYYDEGRRALEMLYNEPVIGVMLMQYGMAYVDATPHTEKIRGTVNLGGDVILAVGVAVVTGGSGIGASFAHMGRSIGMFSARVVQLLARAYRMMAKAASRAADAAEEARLLRRHPPRHELPPVKPHDAPDIPKPPPGMARFEPPCFQPGSKIPANKYPEYDRQLKGQENGLNEMTVDDYLQGRERFGQTGRLGKKEQSEARTEYAAKLEEEFRAALEEEGTIGAEAEKQASQMVIERMKTLAALHNPDQVVGGGTAVGDLGDSQVNSSIGSHWKSRVASMDEAARAIPTDLRKTVKMHVKLERCR